MQKICPVCDYPFRDGDKLVAIMLSKFHDIPSGVHYAIEQPKTCVEIVHRDCYDFPNGAPPDDGPGYYSTEGD